MSVNTFQLDEATSSSQTRPITSSMTDTTSSNSPEGRDNYGIHQQQDLRGLYPDPAPAFEGAMPTFLSEHTPIGNPTDYATFDEVLANPSADHLGDWYLGNAYANYSMDESRRQMGG
jgi:hypothetical protein